MPLRLSDLFTLFIIALLGSAVYIASGWDLRASIIVVLLGSIGVVFATAQLALDIYGRRAGDRPKRKLEMELPSFQDSDPRATFWGTLEIWGWMIGLLAAIKVVGLPFALPIFVVIYARWYGASYRMALFLGLLLGGFIFGVYQQIMHVYWPESILGDLFLDELFDD